MRALNARPHGPSRAARAAATARSASWAEPLATSQIGSSVAGLTVVNVRPDEGVTHSPPTNSLAGGNPPPEEVPWLTSHPLEVGLALLHVGGEAFLGVPALEQELLHLPLHG